MVKPGGFKRSDFQSAAQDHDGVRPLQRLIDNPGVGQAGEEGGTESKAESGEKDYETTGPQDYGPQAAGPLAD
jgi:hypothetical protein